MDMGMGRISIWIWIIIIINHPTYHHHQHINAIKHIQYLSSNHRDTDPTQCPHGNLTAEELINIKIPKRNVCYVVGLSNNELKLNGNIFNMKGLSWFGFETGNNDLYGLDKHNMDYYLDFMQLHGFNALRLPCSQQFMSSSANRQKYLNAVQPVASQGIFVITDFHSQVAGLLKDEWNVFMSDIFNEPHDADNNEWADWVGFTEDAALAIWAKGANLFISSPHVCGADVAGNPYSVAGWQAHWDYLFDGSLPSNQAGMVIGEFGTTYSGGMVDRLDDLIAYYWLQHHHTVHRISDELLDKLINNEKNGTKETDASEIINEYLPTNDTVMKEIIDDIFDVIVQKHYHKCKVLPAWKHLELIYTICEDVLRKVVKNCSADIKNQCIEYLENFNVISNMVYVLNSEELEESVANILIILYKHYSVCRLFILGQLSNVCYSYLYLNNRDLNIGCNLYEKNKTQRMYSKQLASGVKTVLMIFRECLLNLKDVENQIDGWVELLCSVIIPLHKAIIDEFIIFDDALAQLSIAFCNKYFLSFIYIFQGMLRYWPITSSKKEQLFLHRISPLLDKADDDIWEFEDKSKCEFRNVFAQLSHRIVDSITNYKCTHYATAEKIYEMLEDDTLQRFLDIYGGKDCWIKLYKSMHDISQKYFWKETIDKTLEFMENYNIPMEYLEIFEKIDENKYDKYMENAKDGHDINEYTIERDRLKKKRIERKKYYQYYQYLNKKYQKTNVAKYQKAVYKNNHLCYNYRRKRIILMRNRVLIGIRMP